LPAAAAAWVAADSEEAAAAWVAVALEVVADSAEELGREGISAEEVSGAVALVVVLALEAVLEVREGSAVSLAAAWVGLGSAEWGA
jgi:hypothetical protein